MRRFFLLLMALLVSLGVVSCGGGGGYAGTTGPNNSLRMSPLLSGVGLPVGYFSDVAKFTQGVGPYYAQSSDPSVGVRLLDDGTLRVFGQRAGKSTVSVQDSSVLQTTIKFEVTVSVLPLITSVGTKLTLNAGDSRTFTIAGGVGPYTVTSSNSNIATVTVTPGGLVTVTGKAKGTAIALITDAHGSTLAVDITVEVPAFSVSPTTATGQVGTSIVLTAIGGIGPYSATSSAPSIASVIVNGKAIEVTLNAAGKATINVQDSTGQNIAVEVTATYDLPKLTVSPPDGTAPVDSTLVFTIVGGVGPFSASSSNPSVASVPRNITGNTFTVTLNAEGKSTITVTDTKGQSVAVPVTATAVPLPALSVNPPSANGAVGSSMVLTVIGGVGPYSVVSANTGVATARVNGNSINVSFLSAGTTTLTVMDSKGQMVSVAVTATALPVPALSVSPGSGLGQVGTSMNFSIIGGVAPFLVRSSTPSVATASVNGRVITANFIAAGTSTFTVIDSAGQTVPVVVTVTDNTPPLSVMPGSASGAAGTNAVLNIVGGTGPFTATSTNPTIASAFVNGNTISVSLLAAGVTTITVKDAKGQVVSVGITVTAGGTTSLRVNPPSTAGQVGGRADLTVLGGVTPFSVQSSNQSVATATLSGTNIAVNFLAVGTSTITVVDGAGQSVQVVVTVTQNVPALRAVPPSTAGQVGTTTPVTLLGGVGPYTIASSNTSVATVSPGTLAVAGTFDVTFAGPGTASITVADSTGATLTIPVTSSLTAIPLAVSPSGGTGLVGDPLQFVVSGGTQPYLSATTGNPAVATATINPVTNVVTVSLIGPGSTSIVVQDSAGGTIAIPITATAATAGVAWVTPSYQSVDEDKNTPIYYQLTCGGTCAAFVSTADLPFATIGPLVPVGGSTTSYQFAVNPGNSGTSGRCIPGPSDRPVTVIVTDTVTVPGTPGDPNANPPVPATPATTTVKTAAVILNIRNLTPGC